jgi:hypothetical protein
MARQLKIIPLGTLSMAQKSQFGGKSENKNKTVFVKELFHTERVNNASLMLMPF